MLFSQKRRITYRGSKEHFVKNHYFYPGYPIIKRGIYYCSRMISAQHGTEFSDSHYEKIKKVYSIWICTNPPEYRRNTINGYSIAETQMVGNVSEEVSNYDLMTAILICL